MSKKKKSGAVVELINEIDELVEFYTLIDPEKIKKFLKENDFLYPVLFEAKDKIHEVFGNEVKRLCLELDTDPEDGWKELFIIIKTNLSTEEAIRYENRFSEEWFLDKIDETKGLLNFTEESL